MSRLSPTFFIVFDNKNGIGPNFPQQGTKSRKVICFRLALKFAQESTTMMTFIQRMRKHLPCSSHTVMQTAADGAVASMDHEARADQPSPPTLPQAIHESLWSDLHRDGELVSKPSKANIGGLMIILLLGAPGIGKKSLINQVLFQSSMLP